MVQRVETAANYKHASQTWKKLRKRPLRKRVQIRGTHDIVAAPEDRSASAPFAVSCERL